MSIQTATPYLILGGHARKALELYARVLGARTETLQRLGDVDQSCPVAHRDRVMHAALRIGKALLMLSDGPDESATPLARGAVCVALDFDDESELRRVFDQLVTTGKPIMPVFDAPWGATFGVVEDAFGVHWMLNHAKTTH